MTDCDIFAHTSLACTKLIEAGADVRHEASNKWTPLHCAAAAGESNAFSLLLEAGADPDAEVCP